MSSESPVESARQAVAAAQASLSTSRGELNSATHALAILKPEDHETSASYQKAALAARAAVTAAEDAVRFHQSKVSLAEAAFAPLEIEALRAEVQCGVVARSLALLNLRDACEQLGPQLGRVREAVAVVRDSQSGIDCAAEGLNRAGANYERPAEDDLAQLVKRLEPGLESTSAALSAALAIVKLDETAPARQAERDEFLRRIEMDRKREYEEACRRGQHGEAEKERAVKEAVAGEKRFHGPRGGAAYLPAKATGAWAQIEIARRNAGLKD